MSINIDQPVEIDYKRLLAKYMELIMAEEGINYIDRIDTVYPPMKESFTPDEIAELKAIASTISL